MDQTVKSNVPDDISDIVRLALREDIGDGDLTGALIDGHARVKATVMVRETATLCGAPWFDEVFNQLAPSTDIQWSATDGDTIQPGQTVCRLEGNARALLTGERTALNFLQTLSGTATIVNRFAHEISDCNSRILDTRKTIPGLRSAQKYAVRVGGGGNHRFGLHDGILIKENHQCVTRSLDLVLDNLRDQQTGTPLIEVEIESLNQLDNALRSGANRVMLDNFCVDDIARAVKVTAHRIELEASGNIDLGNIRQIAETGVDFISVGSITKHVQAIDYSMLFDKPDEKH